MDQEILVILAGKVRWVRQFLREFKGKSTAATIAER
jgi:hypothetical protein